MYQHHPDGLIYVRVDTKTYCDTIANFETDFGQSIPPMPDGATGCIYEPGVRYAISDGHNVIGGGMPKVWWMFGEDAINSIDSLLAAQNKRKEGI